MSECRGLRALYELCGHTFYLPALGPDSIVIDLGASTAAFSIGVNKLTGCFCYCVEATPKNFKFIRETAHIKKVFAAMCGSNDPVILNIVEDEFHWGAIEPPHEFNIVENHEVPGKTLGHLIDELKLEKVDLLKVDIEGAEIAMFDAAADSTLKRVQQISVEFHDFMDPRQLDDVKRQIHRFKRLGFDCAIMTYRGHGDVWIVNRRAVGIGSLTFIYFKTVIKYARGIRRLISRHLRRLGGKKYDGTRS